MADERMSEERLDGIAEGIARSTAGFVRTCVAERLVSELRAERKRADEAAKREREACVAYLRMFADISVHEGISIALRLRADAIERGEHHG